MPELSRCPFSFGSSYQDVAFLIVPMGATSHTYFTIFYLTVLEVQINFSAYHFKLSVMCPHFSVLRLRFTFLLPIHFSGLTCCIICATFTAKFCRNRLKPEAIATLESQCIIHEMYCQQITILRGMLQQLTTTNISINMQIERITEARHVTSKWGWAGFLLWIKWLLGRCIVREVHGDEEQC